MNSPLQLPPEKPVYKFPDPVFVGSAATREAVVSKAVKKQLAMLSKLSLAATTAGDTINTQFPNAKRIATYKTGVPIGILSAILSTSIRNAGAGSPAGVVLAIGNELIINIAESTIVLLQHFGVSTPADDVSVATVSGIANDGESVEYLASNQSLSLYAFGPNDAATLITAGVSFKFAVVG